jgi:hypothetical protein
VHVVAIFRTSTDSQACAPWPAKFCLDVKLDYNTESLLNDKKPLNEYGRGHLLNTVYKVATKYTM